VKESRTKVALQLRKDVFFSPTIDGIKFSGFNSDGQLTCFTLKSRLLYPLMEQLATLLDGRHAAETILEQLPALQRKAAAQILEILKTRGFVYEHAKDYHHLSPALLNYYASQINFISCYADRPAACFERFRKARILLIGSGWTALHTAQALWNNGLSHLTWQPTQAGLNTAEIEQMQALLAQAQQGDPELSLRQLSSTASPNWSIYNMVVFASDRLEEKRLNSLSKNCRQEQVAFYPATFVAGYGRIGPLELPDYTGCWYCGSDNTNPAQATPSYNDAKFDPFFSPSTAALLGNNLAYRVFRYFTFFAGPSQRSLYSFDTQNLAQREKLLIWQPNCPVCQPLKYPVEIWLDAPLKVYSA
jgi:hypothetical protein